MQERRVQLTEDLSDALAGELRTDDVTTAIYATDASLYEIQPLAVATPKSVADVSLLARYAFDQQIPLIPRGAGTGLAGGCLGAGIVVDFSRHMNQVLEVGSDFVRVQPGITLSALNAELKRVGRRFAPDPSNALTTTIGGMIGVDAAGSHAFRIGSTRDHVRSLQCVLMGGQLVELSQEPIARRFAIQPPNTAVAATSGAPGTFLPPVRNETLPLSSLTPAMRKSDVVERLAALLHQSADLIREHQPPLLRNCSGYMLRGLLQKSSIDLSRLITGSEGTLALVTEATLHTVPLDEHRGMIVLMFSSMDAALQAMQLLLVLEPSACDLMDRRLLSLGRDADQRFEPIVHPDAEAGLFIEFNGINAEELEHRLSAAETMIGSTDFPFAVTQRTSDPAQVELIWELPTRVVSLLAGLKGVSRPLPFVEDIAVPPEAISRFLTLAQKTFQKHEVTATLYAHAASGQLHLRPMLPLPRPKQADIIEAIARDLYRHVKAVGGTISGEHGDGLSRTAFIRSMYGPLYRTFQQVKDIFDPLRLLNPDKIITNDGQLTTRYLRETEAQKPSPDNTPLLPVLQLTWTPDEAMEAAARCNGCGTCRAVSGEYRMCPFFHQDEVEDHAPRSKANLLRRLLSGRESADIVADPAVRPVVESCFNCKQCQLECPSEVDIPHLMLEARAEHVATHGLGKTDWLLSRFHTYARFASRFTMTANRMLRHRSLRKILQKTLGIAAERRLPRFRRRSFLGSQRVQSEHNCMDVTSTIPTVVYFVDYFANHHDPELAEAFVRILQHNGFRVYIPPSQTVSGMAMIAVGDLDAAREVADINLGELGEAAREGFPIVCTEPSAALCLSQEYPLLSTHADVDRVAECTRDAGSFLLELHRQGKLKTDFSPLKLKLAYHTPCHVRALGPEAGLYELLTLIPDVQVQHIEKGCTGMAGTFGLAAEHFEQSMAIGRELMDTMRTIDVTAGTTDCSSCRMQMEQKATIPTVHPIKILAIAYGLMPELEASLKNAPAGYLMS